MKYRIFKIPFKYFLLIILSCILGLKNPHAAVVLIDPTESQSILKKITPMEQQKFREMLLLLHGPGALIWKENGRTAEQRAQTLKHCPTLLPDPTIVNAIIDEAKAGLLDTASKAEELFLNYFFQRHVNMDSISYEEKSGLKVATLPSTITDLIVIYNFVKDSAFEEMARKYMKGEGANHMLIYTAINDYLRIHSREFETVRKDSSPATEENYFKTMALALLLDIQKAATSTGYAAGIKKILKPEFDLILKSHSSSELTPKEIIAIAETFSQSPILSSVSIEVDDINHNQFRLWRSVKPFVSYGVSHLGSLSEECILSNIAQGKCLLDFPFPLSGSWSGELIESFAKTDPRYLYNSVEDNMPNLSFGYSLLAGLLFDSRIGGVGASCYSRLLTTDARGEIILRNRNAEQLYILYTFPIDKKALGHLHMLLVLPAGPLSEGIMGSGEGFHPRLARAHPRASAGGFALKPIDDESLILGSGFKDLFLEGSKIVAAGSIKFKYKEAVVDNIKRRHPEDFDDYKITSAFTDEVEHAIAAYETTAEFATGVEHEARASYAELSPIFPHVFHAATLLTRMSLLDYNGYVYGPSSGEDKSPSGISYAEIERQIIQNQKDMLELFLSFIQS